MDSRAASFADATDAAVPNDDGSWHVYASFHASAHGHVANDADGIWKSAAGNGHGYGHGHGSGPRAAAGTSSISNDANLPTATVHGSSFCELIGFSNNIYLLE